MSWLTPKICRLQNFSAAVVFGMNTTTVRHSIFPTVGKGIYLVLLNLEDSLYVLLSLKRII